MPQKFLKRLTKKSKNSARNFPLKNPIEAFLPFYLLINYNYRMSIGWKSFYQLIAANLVMVLVTFLRFNNLPPQIPLFYSKPAGEDQLADTWFILILPLFMNLLFFLNKFLSRRYFKDDLLIHKIFYYLNLFLLVSFTLIFTKIVFTIT